MDMYNRRGRNHSRPARLDIPPILRVHRIHIRKVVHIIQKHIHFNNLVNRGTSRFEDVGQIFYVLVLFVYQPDSANLEIVAINDGEMGRTV